MVVAVGGAASSMPEPGSAVGAGVCGEMKNLLFAAVTHQSANPDLGRGVIKAFTMCAIVDRRPPFRP